jgi:mRNA interferase MazF
LFTRTWNQPMRKWRKISGERRKLSSGLKLLLRISPMKRRKVWWVNFDPSIGGEIKKKRPAVIISNDASNRFLNRVQVIPLTGKTERIYPSEAVVVFKGKESEVMADQLATVSKERLFRRAGILSQEDMRKIEEAIKIQLDIH